MFRAEDIVKDCADATFGDGGVGSTNSNFTRKTYDDVWSGMNVIMRSHTKMHMGVVLPNFARLTFQKELKKPMFNMNSNFLKTYSLRFNARQATKAPETATKDLNFAKLAQLAKCSKDIAKTVYRELTQRLGDVLKDGNNQVAVAFNGIGVLRGNRFRLQFFFEGEKGAKVPKTTASFTRDALDSSKGMAIIMPNASKGPSSHTGGSAKHSHSARLLPEIPSARSVSSRSSSVKNRTQSVPQLHKSISDVIGTAPRNKNLLDDRQLEQENLRLMAERQRAAAKQRRLDEKEFRDEILQMHKETILADDERRAKMSKEKAFKDEQVVQGELALDRKREVAAEYLAAQEMHWPFSVEEEVRAERRGKDQTFREELDKQNAGRPQKAAPRQRPEDSVDPKDPNTWFKPSPGNVYPKFLTPSRSPTRIIDEGGQDPLVLRLAYKRYENTLRKQLGHLKSETKDIEQRERQKEQEIAYRAKRRMDIQRETTEYQRKQVEYRAKQRERVLRETHLETNPDPGRAYPMEQLRDAHRINRAKASLRHALDSQVEMKQEINNMRSTIEKAEDNYFLGCVQEQLELDRAHRMNKKTQEQQAMMATWQRQEQFKKELNKLEKMRDGIVVREGSKVVSQDEIQLPGGNDADDPVDE